MGRGTTCRIQTGSHFFPQGLSAQLLVSFWKMFKAWPLQPWCISFWRKTKPPTLTCQNPISTNCFLTLGTCTTSSCIIGTGTSTVCSTCWWWWPRSKYSSNLVCLRTLRWLHSSKLQLQLLRRRRAWVWVTGMCTTSSTACGTGISTWAE